MVMVCRYCWCWGGSWLGMQWGCRGGLGKSSTWRHQGSFPCTCALGTQNSTTHDVVDEIRPKKRTTIPAARGNPDGGVKISRAHSEPIVRLREGRHFLALKFHRASPQTPVKKRANIANAIATHTIPRPCLQNLAIFSAGFKISESHERDPKVRCVTVRVSNSAEAS